MTLIHLALLYAVLGLGLLYGQIPILPQVCVGSGLVLVALHFWATVRDHRKKCRRP